MRVLILSLALCLPACSWHIPNPFPTPPPPAPEPTPTPEPDPSPICPPVGAVCGCWFKPAGQPWEQLPPCAPPTPTCPEACPAGEECVDPVQGCKPIPPAPAPSLECPAVVVNAINTGTREYKAGAHVGKWFDCTPRVCGDEAVSIAVGRPGQRCVPLGPEGDPSFRGSCEELFNGGPTPRWETDGGATVIPSPLEWQVQSRGVGRIRACDRRGKTCSKWIEVE